MTGAGTRLLASAAAVLLVGAAVTSAASAAPAGRGADEIGTGPSSAATDIGAFYRPPRPLVRGDAGRLLRSREIPAPDGARAWQVLYQSRDATGHDIAVSGIVVAPVGRAPKGGRPVVAWAHATTGIADACAPSLGTSPLESILWLDELIGAGYVVAATDYEGLGTEGIHPYLVGASEAHSVLDSIRAARNLPVDAGRKAVVYGHSQGGHAALFAGELAKSYAPELAVRGVAAGAPVVSPRDFVDDTIREHDTVGFLVMGALGFRAAYPELAELPLLTEASAERADVAVHGCAPQVVEEFAGADPAVVFGVDPRTVTEWEHRLRENAAGRRRSRAPVLYWQGGDDDLTRLASADAYAARACRKGTVLDYRVYPGTNHVTVLGPAHDDVLEFFAAVLSGRGARDTCAGATDTG